MSEYGEFSGEGRNNFGGDIWYWWLVEFGIERIWVKLFM